MLIFLFSLFLFFFFSIFLLFLSFAFFYRFPHGRRRRVVLLPHTPHKRRSNSFISPRFCVLFFCFLCLRHKTFSREQAARRSCVGNAARTTASLLVTRSCATCSVSLQRGFSFVGVAAVALFFFWRVRRIFFNQKNLLRWSGQSTALRESITDLLAASCRVCACSAQR